MFDPSRSPDEPGLDGFISKEGEHLKKKAGSMVMVSVAGGEGGVCVADMFWHLRTSILIRHEE